MKHDDVFAYQAFLAGDCEGGNCKVELEAAAQALRLEDIDEDAVSYDRLDMIRIAVQTQWRNQHRSEARMSEADFLERLTDILSRNLDGDELSRELAALL